MKKTTLILLLMAFFKANSYAQTNTFPLSGNVGIGTTSPGYIFQIYNNNSAGAISSLTNPNTGSNSYAQQIINSDAAILYLNALSSTWTGTGENIASGTTIQGTGSGGLSIGASNASGIIRFFTAGTTANDEKMRISAAGNVGIGTLSPTYNIDVTGNGRFTTGAYVNDGQSFGVVSAAGYSWGNNTLIYKGYNTTQGDYAEILVPGGPVYSANIRLLANGNVGIGTTTPDQALTVNGITHTKEVLVDLAIYPDYVFMPTYHLPTLNEVKIYIDKNHHLPDMPTEADVVKSGLKVGETEALLTKKVEELTLYLIDKDKQVRLQQQQIQKQMHQQQATEKRLQKLENKLMKLAGSKKQPQS